MRKLTGKVAIVTGASKGIGAALAKGLAAAGAAVAVNYAADKAGAERTVTEIISHGGKAIAIQADVAKAADVQRMFEETTHVFGAVDVLVNNAGVFQFEPFEAVTASSISARSPARIRYRTRRSMRRPRGRLIRSRWRWPRNWDPATSGSMPWRRVTPRPRVSTASGLWAASTPSRW